MAWINILLGYFTSPFPRPIEHPFSSTHQQLSRAMLRPDHYFRSPPATAPAPRSVSVLAVRTLSHLRPGALPLPRAAPPLRGKTSNTVRASAPAAREADSARMPALAHREVAQDLSAEVEARLGTRLLPSAVPVDVAEFRNGTGSAVGSLDVRRGAPGSSVVSPTLALSSMDIIFVDWSVLVQP